MRFVRLLFMLITISSISISVGQSQDATLIPSPQVSAAELTPPPQDPLVIPIPTAEVSSFDPILLETSTALATTLPEDIYLENVAVTPSVGAEPITYETVGPTATETLWTPVPTVEATHILISSESVAPSPMVEPTQATGPEQSITLDGTLFLETWPEGVKLLLIQSNQIIATSSLSQGFFDFTDLVPGDYSLRLSAPKYLAAQSEIRLTTNASLYLVCSLKFGDLTMDGRIDEFDVDTLASYQGSRLESLRSIAQSIGNVEPTHCGS